MDQRRDVLKTLAGWATAASAGLAPGARAQDARTVRMIVGFPAGGSTDVVARLFADALRTASGQPVIVENVAGAAGRLGHQRVRGATPDGTTLLVTPAALMTLYPHVYAKLGYAPLKDFDPITSLASLAFTVVVSTAVVPERVRTLDDLVDWFRANPNQASFASGGTGTPMHFAGVMLSQYAKQGLTHVPYKGATPMIQDLLGGQIPVAVTTLTDILPHVGGGRVRVLAVTSPRRSAYLPNVPTMVEYGAREISVTDWFGVFAPAGTPAATLDRLNEQLRAAITTPTIRETMNKLGLEPAGAARADFARTVESDTARWAPVVQATGFRIDE